MIYVDIHTHGQSSENDVISVQSFSLNELDRMSTCNCGNYSVGIHPWEIKSTGIEKVDIIKQLISNTHFKLVGECGLDKNIDVELPIQLLYLEKQIELSEAFGKSLIIHCVGYFNELIQLRKSKKPSQRWIVHGFRGKPQLATQLIKAGFDLSFGENFNKQSVLVTPLEHLFVETDTSQCAIKEIYNSVSLAKNCHTTELTAGVNLLSVKTHF